MAKIPDNLEWKSTGKTVGKGGQGSIIEVVRKADETGQKFALKALSNTTSRQALERFHKEIRAIKNLDHPNIIKVVAVPELMMIFTIT